MPDAWDDGSDAGSDAWDVESDDAALEAKLGLNKLAAAETSNFDDDEDLNLKDKAAAESRSKAALKSKGKALAEKKAAEAERVEEEELARKVMQLEMEREARMTEDERKLLERQRVEESDASIANDLFGGIDDHKGNRSVPLTGAADKIVLVDLKDHLKFAKKISACFKGHQKSHLAVAFFKEALQECRDIFDDEALTDLIKVMNIIKNEKLLAAKRKVKGQAQKVKRDKASELKAKQLQAELYGDGDVLLDKYDQYGEQYEDDFF